MRIPDLDYVESISNVSSHVGGFSFQEEPNGLLGQYLIVLPDGTVLDENTQLPGSAGYASFYRSSATIVDGKLVDSSSSFVSRAF